MAEHTSARAALDLKKLGIKDARALLGGYAGWVASGRRIVQGMLPGT